MPALQKNRHTKSSKYLIKINPKILVLDVARQSKKPRNISITFMRGKKRHKCTSQQLEESVTLEDRGLITWPNITSSNPIIFTARMHLMETNRFRNKKWTVIVEDHSYKNGHKPIAAILLDISQFMNNTETSKEIGINLRPLYPSIESCVLIFEINVQLENEEKINVADSILSTPLTPKERKESLGNQLSSEVSKNGDDIEEVPSTSQNNDVSDRSQLLYAEKFLSLIDMDESKCDIDESKIKISQETFSSTNRLSSFLELTEPEKNVIEDIENMYKSRYDENNHEQSVMSGYQERNHDTNGPEDFKILKVAHPQVSIRQFQKHTPSSTHLNQSKEGSPSLPFTNLTERPIYSGKSVEPKDNFKTPGHDSFLNNIARIGSARGQELVNSLVNLMPTSSSSLPRPNKKRTHQSSEYKNTPTRKLSTKFRIFLPEEIQEEFMNIETRRTEIEKLISFLDEKLRNSSDHNGEELKLIEERQNYVKEKDFLSHREDLCNKSLDFYETEAKRKNIKQKLNELTTHNELENGLSECDYLTNEFVKLTDRLNEIQLEIEDANSDT